MVTLVQVGLWYLQRRQEPFSSTSLCLTLVFFHPYRIISERFLPPWWQNLSTTLTTDKFVDVKAIHRFDPQKEHMGGGGKAGPWLDLKQPLMSKSGAAGDDTKKQGAYGKIKTHSESLVSQLLRINEVMAALRIKFFSPFKEQAVGK